MPNTELATIRRLGEQALRGSTTGSIAIVTDALNRLDSIGEHAWNPVLSGWAGHAIDALRRGGTPPGFPILYASGQWQLRFAGPIGEHLAPEKVASPLDLLALRLIVAVGNDDHDTAHAFAATARTDGVHAGLVVTVLRTTAALSVRAGR
jgi:hypothetical protein